MKTRNWQSALAATLLGLTFGPLGAADAVDLAPADGPPVAPEKASPPAPVIDPAPAVNKSPDAAPANTFRFPNPSLPPLLDQVVRLNQSGTDESIVRAYIEKAAPPYQITGNEILQLQERGVPKNVILSLIEHSKTVTSATPVAPAPPTVPVDPPATGPAAPTNSQTIDAEAGTAEAAADFREPLAPYGTWMDVPGYGYCWQPTVVVVNPSWRPYCDNGDWRWSDSGWYWHSYYSWGWAPFHYGRWFAHSGSGWLWCPDRVWGPAWVSWRSSGTYCGWAPLPPGACFVAGRGWTFRGVSVGVDFSFGLGVGHFTFVAHDRFSERHVGTHAVRGQEASAHYRNTTVVNGYTAGRNNRVINHGVGRERIAAASQTPIREVAGAEPSRVGQRIAAPTRINLVNSAHRGVAAASVARPAGIRPVPADSGRGNLSRSMSQAMPNLNRAAASRSVVAGGGAQQRAMPNFSRNSFGRIQAAPPNRGVQTMPAQRTAMAARYQPRTFSSPAMARHAPVRSFAPSVNRAPRFSGSSMGRAVSPGGGGQFRGTVARGGASARSVGVRR